MSNKITIVGLGPGGKEYLTLDALDKIKETEILYLRTEKHPVIKYISKLGTEIKSFDSIYNSKENFEDVYDKIVDKLINMSKKEDIVYGVPGSPFVAEYTVQKLIEVAEKEGVILEFVTGVSFLEAIINEVRRDPVGGLKIIDALQMDIQKPDVEVDVVITQVYNRLVASDVKLRLMEYYDDEYEIIVIRGAGIKEEQKILPIPLYKLDRIEFLDHLTSIFIPKIGNNIKNRYRMDDLTNIMIKLRSQEGCPWDREQNHNSLKPYLLEESYEVLEALEEENMELLEEELGDLLLQIVFHSQIASENGDFDIIDVISGICQKLISRHPHVFGDIEANTSEKVLENWEEIKRSEKEEKSYTESLLRVPKYLPALMRSYKIQGKAAKVGFDWDVIEDAMEKVYEELKELKEAMENKNSEEIFEEVGDLIFAVVNVARFLKVRPELALNKTIDKFIARFQYIEEEAKKKGQDLKDMNLQEMDNLWNQAKKIEKKD